MKKRVPKNHDCLSKVREQIMKADPSVKWVRFNYGNIQDTAAKNPTIKTGQGIEVGFVKTKRDGSKVDKTEKSFITHDFCPFCGLKY